MKAAPVEETVRVGSLRLEVRRYADGRYGFDFTPPGERRVKVRLGCLNTALLRAQEILGAARGGKVERLAIDEEEYAEFLLWKAQRKPAAAVSQLVPSFLKSRENKGRTAATVRELSSTLLPFAKEFPGPISALKRDQVEKWLDGRKVGPRRWNNMRAAICALHHYARRDGYLSADLTPVERIERRAVAVNIETYSPGELERLLAVTPLEWIPLIALGAFCGLRPEEISPDPRNGGWKPGLAWENVLWAKGKIDVPAKVSKVRRRRFATLTDAAAAWLAPWRQSSGPVVPKRDYHRLTGAWTKAAGIQWKDNGLRHSYASYRLAVIPDVGALALELGNSPTMIFRHYLDLKHEDEAQRWFGIRPNPNVLAMIA
jgi:integrase